ncbi:transient receptor potential cation channel trpm isoform X2 [Centruroides vittatus]|uniref:transient receptor potential cation channel trpm isoform X2 n=1 Tax=Centruroides vittatus TaxID=120091 RepID=UPI003510BC4D
MNRNWIETHFEKRECIKFIPSKESGKCGCGRSASTHIVQTLQPQPSLVVPPNFCSDDSSQTSGDEHWSSSRHTALSPTDAYGIIEFLGSQHPLKARFIRLSYDTRPEVILKLLTKQWNLQLPKLLITVHGGKANFQLQPKLKSVLHKGLVKAAKTTRAWIFTAGTNTGVMRHVGDALLNERTPCLRSRVVTIGIAPWGIIQDHQQLLRKNVVVPYYSISSPKSRYAVLNSNHSYFLLVDNGTVGRYGGEISLRKRLEKHIAKQKIYARSNMESGGIPVVCVIVEGGLNTIRTVLEYVTDSPPVPVVICDGSGRAADLLAFAHKYLQDDNNAVLESVREQLLATIEKTFKLSREQAEQLHIELVQCVQHKDLITVFRMGEGPCQELDEAVLTALLKGQHLPAPDQLQLALTWNRVDIARKEIFIYGQEWPAGSLNQAMMNALILGRVDFVKVLLENGVSMQNFLTISRLEELYNSQLGPRNILRYLITDIKKNVGRKYRILLYDIGLIVDKLIGGAYCSSYCRRKFRHLYNNMMKNIASSPTLGGLLGHDIITARLSYYESTPFEYPFNELLVWAVLTNRQKMALFIGQSGEEVIVKALIACILYKAMAREAAQDDMETDLYEELRQNAREFKQLALDLLDYCYHQDKSLTLQLLTFERQNWSKQTCLGLAVMAKHRAFLAHSASQMLLADLWMGGLRTRKNANSKVIFALLFPPAIFKLEFKSTEELKLMPQTEEEHIWNLQKNDTDSNGNENEKCSLDEIASHYKTPRKESYAILHAISLNTSYKLENGKPLHLDSTDLELSMEEKQKKGSPRIGKKVYEFYAAPITKFWGHTLAYTIFLLLYTYVVLVRLESEPSWQEYFVISYLSTLLLEKFREILCSEPVKFSAKISVWLEKKWNPCDVALIIIFLIALKLRLDPNLQQVGRSIYCVNIMYWYIRILDLVSINKYLGPYVTMIGKMVIDMLYFVVLLLVILMCYGVARQAVLFPYEEASWNLITEIFYLPYFMLYGEVFLNHIKPKCGEDQNLKPCGLATWINPLIMSIYLLISNILLVNLLIAVFNNIFVEVNAISQQVWKSNRFQVVMEYEQKPSLPPPLIIFSHLYLLFKYYIRRWKGKPKGIDYGLKLFLDEESIEKINDFEEECAESYFHEKELQSTTDQQIQIVSERVENTMQKINDINQRQKDINGRVQNLEFQVNRIEQVSQDCFESLSVMRTCMKEASSPTSLLQKHDDSILLESEHEDDLSPVPSIEDTSLRIQIDNAQENQDKPSTCKESYPSRVSFVDDDIHTTPPLETNQSNTAQTRLQRFRPPPLLSRQQTIAAPENLTRKLSESSSSGLSRRHPLQRGKSISYLDSDEMIGGSQVSKVGRSLSCTAQSYWLNTDPSIYIIPPTPKPPHLSVTKGEYTSITDDLENTACINQIHLQHQYSSESRSSSIEQPQLAIETETLYDAEETDYHLMKGLIRRRLHSNLETVTGSLEELQSIHSDSDSISEEAGDSVTKDNQTSDSAQYIPKPQTQGDFWSETTC